MKKYTDCAVCGAMVASRSRYCEKHKQKLARYGSPTGKALPMKGKRNAFDLQMRIARRYMQLHADNPAVAAALKLAEAIFNYTADTKLSADVKLQEVLNCQRDLNADPAELCARVVAFYLFTAHRPTYFQGNQRAEDCALGRLILHVVPLGGHYWSAAVYVPAGVLARKYLGIFALKLIARVERDAESVQALVKQTAAL